MSGLEQDFKILERVSTVVADAPAPHSNSQKTDDTAPRKKWGLPGIYSGTRISTSFGEVPAHLVRVRDQLRTRNGDYQRVVRIDEYKLDAEFLSDHPEARPIRFSGKRGDNAASVFVSPGQRILARGSAGQEVLRNARDLTDQPGIVPDTPGPFSYFVFHLGEAALVRAEGLWVALGE